MKTLKLNLMWITAVVLIAFSSCSDDDEIVTEEETGTEEETVTEEETASDINSGYAVWLITNSSDFSGMLITSDTMFTGEIDPSEASYKSLGLARNTGASYNGSIYNLYNTSGDPGIQKYTYENNTLTDDGFIIVGESSYAFDVVSEEKGYYTDSELSRTGIQIFNPTTMERTGEIDITDAISPYITDDISQTRLGGFMMANDGYLYTEVFFYDGTSSYHQYYDSTFVAVFDISTDEFVNLAIYPAYSWLGFDRKNCNYVNVSDDGDLYMASCVGNLTDRQHSRCFRIKQGETEFDDWVLDYDDIIGEEGSWSLGGSVVQDGKMYIRLKETAIAADYSNMTDEDMCAYEIDLDTKEATKIEGIPGSSASTLSSVNGPAIIDSLVYFSVSNSDFQGYYSYDPETGETNEAFSFTGGIPSQLVAIE